MQVKILLEGETELEAEQLLAKAFTVHESGSAHSEDFEQPSARAVVQKMLNLHDQSFDKLIKQIYEVLESEV